MTGVLGGLLAALMWGTSTAIASRSTRMIGSQQVLAYVMLTGIVLMAVAAPVVEGVPTVTGRGAAWALAAGATLEQAAAGGEDYELLAALPDTQPQPSFVTDVGELTGDEVVLLLDASGPRHDLAGWDHFQ